MMSYQILYADPPWKYGGSGGTKWRSASTYYKVMTFDELKEFGKKLEPVVCWDSCLLFMWVVNPELPRCIEVGNAWGFRYITTAFFWYKMRANVGNYTMPQVEQCLLFKIGKIPSDRVRNPGVKSYYESLYEEPVSGHSRKPDEFRKRIQAMYPKSKKLELFARENYSGWDAYGNQVERSIQLQGD